MKATGPRIGQDFDETADQRCRGELLGKRKQTSWFESCVGSRCLFFTMDTVYMVFFIFGLPPIILDCVFVGTTAP